jgi:hypothetical protein
MNVPTEVTSHAFTNNSQEIVLRIKEVYIATFTDI